MAVNMIYEQAPGETQSLINGFLPFFSLLLPA